MKYHIVCIISCLLICSTALADEKTTKPPANDYNMSLMRLYTEDYPMNSKWIILLDNKRAFNSVGALKAYLKGQLKGTKLTWNPGCIRNGGEPLLSNPKEMDSFKSFCIKHAVEFVIIPSG